MRSAEIYMPAGEFKARCLNVMEQVNATRIPVVITKRGVPVAKLVPIAEKALDLFGCLQGSVTIQDDIIAPIDESWDAAQ